MAITYTLDMATEYNPCHVLSLIAEQLGVALTEQPDVLAGKNLWIKVRGPRDDPYYTSDVDDYGFHANLIVTFRHGARGDLTKSHRLMLETVFLLLKTFKGDAAFEEDNAPATILKRIGGMLIIDRNWFNEFREYGIEPPSDLTYRIETLPKL